MRWKLLVVLLFAAMWASGCATVFTGTKENVTFESEPEEAEIMINGASHGKTPLSINLQKKDSYTIVLKKDCYEDKKFYVTRTMQMEWAILDWALSILLIPVAVDWYTGAWYEFDKNHVTVKMNKKNQCSDGGEPPEGADVQKVDSEADDEEATSGDADSDGPQSETSDDGADEKESEVDKEGESSEKQEKEEPSGSSGKETAPDDEPESSDDAD